MKKYLLTILIMLLGSPIAFAGSEITLVKGSVLPLKDGGLGCVVIDMSDTQFDNKKPLRNDSRFANVDDDISEYISEFIREFNEKSKKFRLTSNNEEAKYEINVHITNLDVFVHLMSFKGGVGIKLWGTITIKDKMTNEVIAEYKIDEDDNSGFTYSIALEEGFEGIAKFLAKRINKGK